MPRKALDHVAVGERLPTDIATWNPMIDAGRLARERKGQGAAPGGGLTAVPALEVYVRNDTGGTLAAFSVVKLGDPVISASSAPHEARRTPCFDGIEPEGPNDNYAVLVEPLADGATGRAIVRGVAVCDLDVADEDHTHAFPAAGVTATLETGFSGSAIVLWKATGTGTKRAIVLLCCPDTGSGGPPPGPPTSVTTTPGFNALTVNWVEPTAVPPAANYLITISTSSTFSPNTTFSVTVAAPATNYTFSNLSSTVIGSSFNNLYVAIQAVSANNTFSSWVTTTEPRPVPNTLVVNSAGTTLTVGWSSNATFSAGSVTITGTQSLTATYSSGTGTNSLVFNTSGTVFQGSTVTCSLPAALVNDGSGNDNVLTSGAATNNSTATCSGAVTLALLDVASYVNSDRPLYKFTAGSTATHKFTLTRTSGSGSGTINVYATTCTGTSLGSATANSGTPACVAIALTSGTVYYIQHTQNSGPSDDFDFSIATGSC